MMPPRFPVGPIGANPVGPIRSPYPVRPGGRPPISSPYPVAPIARPIASPTGNEQPPNILGLPSGISRPVGGPPDVLGMPSGVSGAYPISGPPITSPMPGPMPFRGAPMFPGGNPSMQQFGGQMPPFNLVNLAQLLANKQRGF
jgi:hypothetical protein